MPNARSSLPTPVMLGLAVAVVLDTAIQIAWKMALAGMPANSPFAAVAAAALKNPLFYLAMALLVAQLVNWTRVLARADLSFAQPFTALSYITVMAFSSRLLHESLSARKLGGVALILVGVYFISRTPSRTAASGEPQNPPSTP